MDDLDLVLQTIDPWLSKYINEGAGALSAIETASLLASANADVPDLPLPDDREARIARLEEIAISSRFGALETEFYDCREDRIRLLAVYLRRLQNGV